MTRKFEPVCEAPHPDSHSRPPDLIFVDLMILCKVAPILRDIYGTKPVPRT